MYLACVSLWRLVWCVVTAVSNRTRSSRVPDLSLGRCIDEPGRCTLDPWMPLDTVPGAGAYSGRTDDLSLVLIRDPLSPNRSGLQPGARMRRARGPPARINASGLSVSARVQPPAASSANSGQIRIRRNAFAPFLFRFCFPLTNSMSVPDAQPEGEKSQAHLPTCLQGQRCVDWWRNESNQA